MEKYDALCQLVIRNMDVIEEAPAVVEKTQDLLFKAINEHVKKNISSRSGWDGVYDVVVGDEKETTFAPANWPMDESGENYQAWYTLWYTAAEEDIYWLSCALGVHDAALCLKFDIGNGLLNIPFNERKARCKKFYTTTPALQKAGFQYETSSGAIFRPFTLNAEVLAAGFPNFEDALAPVDDALKDLFEVHPLFDKFVTEIQQAEAK